MGDTETAAPALISIPVYVLDLPSDDAQPSFQPILHAFATASNLSQNDSTIPTLHFQPILPEAHQCDSFDEIFDHYVFAVTASMTSGELDAPLIPDLSTVPLVVVLDPRTFRDGTVAVIGPAPENDEILLSDDEDNEWADSSSIMPPSEPWVMIRIMPENVAPLSVEIVAGRLDLSSLATAVDQDGVLRNIDIA